ncbi:MAG: TolC family protein [FCB group bacterium]|jgi:cobalt-zinc-cadmium efflux system outer membrane protein
MKKLISYFIFFAVFLIFNLKAYSDEFLTDTLKLSLADAEKQFFTNNYRLLISKLNIDAAQAGVVQARLWNNPNISIEQNIFNQYTHRWFDVTSSGNTEIQLQQLILLAGKRDKQINLAKVNINTAQYQFYDFVRALKSQLRKTFYDLYFLQSSLQFYDESINSVRKTVKSSEAIYENRLILFSEVLRLKALLLSLETEKQRINSQITDLHQTLKILLGDSSQKQIYYVPVSDLKQLDGISILNFKLQDLKLKGLYSRPDLKIAQSTIEYEEKNLEYQKALAVPDLTIGGRWSRQGSYIVDYFALSLSIDLPLFNRNQGNINLSETTLNADKLIKENVKMQIESDIASAYDKAVQAEKLYKSYDKSFAMQFKEYVQNMLSNYEKRLITIIEFADFYDSYKSSMLQLNQLANLMVDSIEDLNYAVGIDVITY